ncbi:hypothetical protein BDP55DRAFT_659715 [Colletotrichum godetiae]|uniref:Uncharacterized protein n=1 Tax=Colletotrichum godetiae TaxID=1209918 RepID=A0AAJ0AS67_9PEZI|nr:uncharacterized protein BDP55DRAFT_659715 [Colletotrichum godetiae]KAK1687845.1 hypothetical protein BDP55DRAFT_659715 [Colletotrichum godetiae]
MSVEFDVISREPTPSAPSDWTRPSHLAFLCFLFACSSLLHVIKRDSWGRWKGHASYASAEPFSSLPCTMYVFISLAAAAFVYME